MTQTLIKRWFRPEVLALSAYHVADAKNFIKLDAMENPFPWPETIQAEWLDSLKNCEINRYPDPEARELVKSLRQSQSIPDDLAVILGNGSDEIIQILLMALNSEASVLVVEPSFVMYKQIAVSLGLNYQSVPLQATDFSLDLDALLEAIKLHQPALIFLAYPNNPTGNLFSLESLEAIIQASPGIVVIDEAYAPFTDASFLPRIQNYKHVVVMRTVSKLGLAGLRLGYLVGSTEILDELNKIRLPYNINILTQLTAKFALDHQGFLQQQTTVLRAERANLLAALNALTDIQAYPSQANFIMFRCLNICADTVFDSLKQQGILIKNLSRQGGLLTDCLRVTVGTPEENLSFLKALQLALQPAS